ncbi:mechanosensitive ion channel protein MscS [Nonlabens sp. MIC269]|uniref:mechanosensitive ion channel family protein n=1 Tax=Nonlabens sp. MIC269 TaxID=1476901 RepID=UPI000722C2B9|nr:mechanosensitive ion channel family protein [Nonlabens sp. MIC269]ALM20637.1 mechanosensitive ion channel protein MscS [Nonlabens sp. MIC269]
MIQEQTTQKVQETTKQIEDVNSTELIWDQLTSWYEAILRNLPNLAVAVVVLLIAYIISKFVNRGVQRLLKSKVEQQSVLRLIGRTAAIIVVIGGMFIALNVLDLNETVQAIIAGAGVSGLVIGLALQGTLSNTMSGIHLSFRKNVRIGDWVQTNGYEGEIIAIDLNKFILREADNNTVIIPNKMILENPLKNFGLTDTMRVIIHCGVGYESDLPTVEKIAKQAILDNFDQVNSFDEVEFFYREFADSSINFMLRFYYDITNGKKKLEVTSKAIMVIKKAFDDNDINIPFPIRTLEFNNQLNLQQPSNKEA